MSHLEESTGGGESDNEPTFDEKYQRVMKKGAVLALFEEPVYLAKYNKRTDSVLEETLTKIPKTEVDQTIILDKEMEQFFTKHSANKSTTRFYVEV